MPIDQPFLVLPLNLAAPKIVVFLGWSTNSFVSALARPCGLLPILLEKNKLS